MAEIANKPFNFSDCFWGFGSCLFLLLVGGFAGKLAVESAQQGPESIGWTAFLFVVAATAILLGIYMAYATISLPLDRSTKISITMTELIDHRLSPPLVVQLADIREIRLNVAKLNGVPQSELITLELCDYREPVKLQVLGLERDSEEICTLLEGRVNRARRDGHVSPGKSLPCPACNGKGRLTRPMPDGVGVISSNCETCRGSGLTPGPEQDAWFRESMATFEQIMGDLMGPSNQAATKQGATPPPKPQQPLPPGAKRICSGCRQPSPGEARKCYHCGAEF